jgi:glycosyltransferase involved in cell wall biosynthesis
MTDLSIVIPFYNEEGNAQNLLDNLVKHLDLGKRSYEVIAVNNGSVDKTPEILEKAARKNKKIKVATVKKNIGYGFGIKTGLEKAKGKIIGYLWADSISDATRLWDLASKLENSNVALIKISRVKRNDALYRRIQSRVYNTLFWLMFGIKSHDINGCPKLMKRSVYKTIKLKSNDWFLDPEIMLKVKKMGFKYKEIPVESDKRVHGKSHVKTSTFLEFIKNMTKYKLRGF